MTAVDPRLKEQDEAEGEVYCMNWFPTVLYIWCEISSLLADKDDISPRSMSRFDNVARLKVSELASAFLADFGLYLAGSLLIFP